MRGGEVAGHRHPVLVVLGVDELGHRREVLGVMDVLLGEGHAAVRPLLHRVLDGLVVRARPGHVIWSSFGEVVTSLPASFAPSSYLSQSIAIFSSAAPTVMIPSANLPVFFALTRTGGRDVDGDPVRLVGERVQAGALEREELALVLDDLAREQLVDDLDRLEQHRAADADLGQTPPTTCSLSASPRRGRDRSGRVHRPERRCRVRDDGGVVTEPRARHRRPEGEADPSAGRARP